MNEFENIKTQMLSKGFVWDEGQQEFTLNQTRTQNVIINGQQMSKDLIIIIHIIYNGEGYIEDEDGSNHSPLFGFSVVTEVGNNKQNNGCDVWVRDYEELASMFNFK